MNQKYIFIILLYVLHPSNIKTSHRGLPRKVSAQSKTQLKQKFYMTAMAAIANNTIQKNPTENPLYHQLASMEQNKLSAAYAKLIYQRYPPKSNNYHDQAEADHAELNTKSLQELQNLFQKKFEQYNNQIKQPIPRNNNARFGFFTKDDMANLSSVRTQLLNIGAAIQKRLMLLSLLPQGHLSTLPY